MECAHSTSVLPGRPDRLEVTFPPAKHNLATYLQGIHTDMPHEATTENITSNSSISIEDGFG